MSFISFWKHRLGKLGLIVFAVTGVCLAGGVIGFWRYRGLPELVSRFVPVGAAMLILTAWGLVDFVRGNNRRATLAVAAFMTVTVLAIALVASPALEEVYMYKDLALEFGKLIDDDTTVCSDLKDMSSLVFYSRRRVSKIRTRQGLDELMRKSKRVICIARRSLNDAAESAGGTKLAERRCFNIAKMKWQTVTLWMVGDDRGQARPEQGRQSAARQ